MKCDNSGCKHPGVYCEWFTRGLGKQKASLCQEHMGQLWSMLNPLCQLNEASFRIVSVCDLFAEWWIPCVTGWAD